MYSEHVFVGFGFASLFSHKFTKAEVELLKSKYKKEIGRIWKKLCHINPLSIVSKLFARQLLGKVLTGRYGITVNQFRRIVLFYIIE